MLSIEDPMVHQRSPRIQSAQETSREGEHGLAEGTHKDQTQNAILFLRKHCGPVGSLHNSRYGHSCDCACISREGLNGMLLGSSVLCVCVCVSAFVFALIEL